MGDPITVPMVSSERCMSKNGGEEFLNFIFHPLEASLDLQSFGHFGRGEVTIL